MNSCHKSSRLDRCQIASSTRKLKLQLHPSMLNNKRPILWFLLKQIKFITLPSLSLQVRACATRLDNVLDNRLSAVPVLVIQSYQIDTIVLGNLTKGLETLSIKDKADADTNTSESTSTTNTMKVSFGIRLIVTSTLHWNVVIDDHRDGGNINTSGQDVGSNKNLCLALSEVFENAITFGSLEGSVNCNNVVTVLL
jgi:hypothetical protein